jgi:hypothetical protein
MRNYKEMEQVLELLQFSDENNTSLSGNMVMLLRDKGMLTPHQKKFLLFTILPYFPSISLPSLQEQGHI